MKFFNVKTRQSVTVKDSDCTKVKYVKGTRTTYAAKAVVDGTPCTRFPTKAAWEALDCPEK